MSKAKRKQHNQEIGLKTGDFSRCQLLPRLIRFTDAPRYLGMDRNRFNDEVRPYVTEIPIGKQGKAFDRLDLDAWVDQYKACNGRPGKPIGGKPWDADKHQASLNEANSGTLTKKSEVGDIAKALAKASSKKRRST